MYHFIKIFIETSVTDKPSMNERMVKTDSDSEDPLYSTVKPKNVSVDSEHHQLEDEHKGAEDESSSRSKKKVPKITFHSTKKKLQGVENRGFVGKAYWILQLKCAIT